MPRLSNRDLAELLALRAQEESGVRQRALKRAARAAFLWPEEATALVDAGRSLTELHGVGPFIAAEIQRWLDDRAAQRTTGRDPLRDEFLTLAEAGAILASDPAWSKRLRGDLQMHTAWSDGGDEIGAMAAAARSRGYSYIAITDHSKGLKIAGGIDEETLRKQSEEITAFNRGSEAGALTVLRSIEMNLNPKGEGDMEPAALRKLDLVLGAFHSALRAKDDQTARYLAAIRNPHVHILAHPRGRVYNFRSGLQADWPRVFAEAARLDKAVEVDCYPDRQDLNVSLLELAREAGCRISLGTDAHFASQLGFIELGLAATLKAGISAERILNFMPLAQLHSWVASLRRD